MGKIIRLTENELNSIIKNIVEEVEPEEYTEIDSKKFYNILENLAFNMKIATRTRKGNKLKVIGALDLSDKPITTLGNLGWITGSLKLAKTPLESIGALEYVGGDLNLEYSKLNDLGNLYHVGSTLDISNTNISDISNVSYRFLREWGSKHQKIKQIAELNSVREDAIERKENNEWDLEYREDGISDEGLMANAIYKWLRDDNQLDLLEIDDDDDLGVYNLIPSDNDYYSMRKFNVLNDYFNGSVFAIGDEQDIQQSAIEYAETRIDDEGVDTFPQWMLEECIDKYEVKELAQEIYNQELYDSPESYFDMSENTNEDEISELDDRISELEDEQNDLDDESEDYDDEYDRLESEINTLRDRRDKLEEEGSEISDDMKEEKIEELVNEAVDDPLGFLNNLGYAYKNYIDNEKLANRWVDLDGYEMISYYDGEIHEVVINDKLYYIIRIE